MDFDPRMLIEGMIILILSITVHEFGHAFVADRLGDRLPRSEGRVTLNPIAHMDPIGTLLFPLLSMMGALGGIGFGWGRPVMVNPSSFTRRMSMRTGHLIVAAAGPTMNILFGLFISLILFALDRTGTLQPTTQGIYEALSRAILMNFILAFFNLIPAPPLDGGTVLAGILPESMMPAYNRFAKYGILVLAAFILIRPLKMLFIWPAMELYRLVCGTVLGLPTF